MKIDNINYNIVYITDKPIDKVNIDLASHTLEGNPQETSELIYNSLCTLSEKVYFYDSIEDFSMNIEKHRHDLVFTTLYGKTSASSKALVPAICEANQIKYVGADSYSQMLCNDKHLSKKYASEFDISSANDILIRDERDNHNLSLLSLLQYPVVIKPNFGGGSTGISEKNIRYSYEDARNYAIELYNLHKQPILVEEYISGYEVELILLGHRKKIEFCEEVQILFGKKAFFTDYIWGYESKKIDDNEIIFSNSNYFSSGDISKMINLFNSFSKIEFMRIDCRINKDGFKLIELSPDCYLGKDGAYFYAFEQKGYSFEKMLYKIINNSL